jgi:ATP-dependent DNA helicase RecQ
LRLTRGKAIFRAAMNIVLNAEASRRQFNRSDYAELEQHYVDKVVQIHVIAEYARLAIRKIQAAMTLVADYFRLSHKTFIQGYFSGHEDVLKMATTEEACRRILIDLKNPEQQGIVDAPLEGSRLVLAGPGAGKTRVIVHRVAWLLRKHLTLPEEIMVLTYNRAAAAEISHRLWTLIGADAAGVTVQTLHGLAMRLTGTSYAVAAERGDHIDFTAAIRQATDYLRQTGRGDDATSVARDRLLAGLRFLLVDEYQDLNGDHYALISALAGRTLSTEEDRLSLTVVGDDDQNIYAFGGASVEYIRRFEKDYDAKRHQLIENFRSSAHIIRCANRVIAPARERMKEGREICIDHARKNQPDGGIWTEKDPLAAGRVHVLEVPRTPFQEAAMALDDLQRLHALRAGGGQAGCWGHFSVIARTWDELEPLATLCHRRGIPARLARDALQVNLYDTREGCTLLSLLRGERRRPARKRLTLRSGVLGRWFHRRHGLGLDDWIDNPFLAAMAQFIAESETSAQGYPLVTDNLVEALYEFGNGTRVPGKPRANSPLMLMTAHRAKGLEFDHVLILDGGGWQKRGDDERRLFYVAMTRARQTLTLCETIGGQHAFVKDTGDLPLRTRPGPSAETEIRPTRWMCLNPRHIYLSWPGTFGACHPIHQTIAGLELGDPLMLRTRRDGKPGWELADSQGIAVGRMSAKFSPPPGEILAVRVAAILVRHKKPDDRVKVPHWELVLPEFEYVPA